MQVQLKHLPVGATFCDPGSEITFRVTDHEYSGLVDADTPDVIAAAEDGGVFTVGECSTIQRFSVPGDVFRFPGNMEVDEDEVVYVSNWFFYVLAGLHRQYPAIGEHLRAIERQLDPDSVLDSDETQVQGAYPPRQF